MCGMSCACAVGLIISGFIALIAAGLFFGGAITEITIGIFIALVISIVAVLYLIVSLSNCNSCSIDCFRSNGVCLLLGAIGTIVFAIIALSITLTPGTILRYCNSRISFFLFQSYNCKYNIINNLFAK